jgi:hypothetical protein
MAGQRANREAVSKGDGHLQTRRFRIELFIEIQRDLAAFAALSNRQQQVWRTTSYGLPVDAPKIVHGFLDGRRARKVEGSEGSFIQLCHLAKLGQRGTRVPLLPCLKSIGRDLETVRSDTRRKPRCLAGPDKELRVDVRLNTACHSSSADPVSSDWMTCRTQGPSSSRPTSVSVTHWPLMGR